MAESNRFNLRQLINYGLLAGIVSLSLSAIGMVDLFSKRDLIAGVLSLGQVFLFAPSIIFAYVAARKAPEGKRGPALLNGLLTGLISSILLVILVLLATAFDLRQFLPNVSPALIKTLTFGQSTALGVVLFIMVLGMLGVLAAGLHLLPNQLRDPILKGILLTLVIGMFSETLLERLRYFFGADFAKLIFSGKALRPDIAIFLFALTFLYIWLVNHRGYGKIGVILALLIAGLVYIVLLPLFIENVWIRWAITIPIYILAQFLIIKSAAGWSERFAGIKQRFGARMETGQEEWEKSRQLSPRTIVAQSVLFINRRSKLFAGAIVLLILPLLLGTYLSEVTNMVLIYVLMGFGLNIVVGFAGLLDLGYVAFFAIGAYTMALLTSTSALGIAGVSFWVALPICVLVAVVFGVILGVPVLRMRGDYLAIVTLGFGEIIRILALSDLLKPFIGGAQGILQINKPAFLGLQLVEPTQFYYVVVAGCILAAFVSWRLSESRLGRQWMALREDEDVAEAMGINLVATKLLAFGIGAGFSGLSGAIFASKLTSIFPHSFSLMVSINVLCLIIVGGMGSLPGVIVGALALVGLPELLREFNEYRLLAYGALLIVMMLLRPEGLWPSAVRKRELHIHDETAPIPGEAD